MNDREFLMWIHERLSLVYGDRELLDFMHRLRSIIASIPSHQETPIDGRGKNSLKELQESLKDEVDA